MEPVIRRINKVYGISLDSVWINKANKINRHIDKRLAINQKTLREEINKLDIFG